MSDLLPLLISPSEALTVEYKGWLSLPADQEHCGLLAKALIAIANEGGGHVILGMREDGLDYFSDQAPEGIDLCTQDTINSIIKRFAEPSFHCRLEHVDHPSTGVRHPIISVPGGHAFPIMSKSGTAKGSIRPHLCYIRKPGPESEPPLTHIEWSRLLDRCLRNRQADMLDAIRTIVQGRPVSDPPEVPSDQVLQDAFVQSARKRWETLISPLPVNAPSRCPLGHYECDFVLLGREGQLSLPQTIQAMQQASQTRLTGWTPFWMPTRQAIEPYPYEDNIECWLGAPDTTIISSESAHSDFWQVSTHQRGFLLRGYNEDCLQSVPAGTVIDVTLPVWRIGEIVLYVGRLAKQLGGSKSMLFHVRWTGLKGRRLTFVQDWSRSTGGNHICRQDTVDVKTNIDVHLIDENLPEIILPLLKPMYETFSFFELEPWLVAEELQKLRRNRF